MSDLKKELKEIFESHDISKFEINLISGNPKTLEIKLMKSDGTMDMNTCEIVSREISAKLDEINYSDSAYNLDVCSFGAEYSLDTLDEIKAHLNGHVHVELKDPKKGLDQVEGTLTSVKDENIEIEYLDKGRRKTAEIELENVKVIRTAVKV